MANNTLQGNTHVAGTLSATSMSIPNNTVDNADVKSDAAIGAEKLQHQHSKKYAQKSGTVSVSESEAIHAVYGAVAEVIMFRAWSITPNVGAATITVDLKKNGVSVLTSVITLNNTHAARQVVDAVILTSAGAAGNVYEVTVVATAGGGTVGSGVGAQLEIRESAAP